MTLTQQQKSDLEWVAKHKESIEGLKSIARGIFALAIYLAFAIGNYYLLNSITLSFQTIFMEVDLFFIASAAVRISLGKSALPKDKFVFVPAFAPAFALAFALAVLVLEE